MSSNLPNRQYGVNRKFAYMAVDGSCLPDQVCRMGEHGNRIREWRDRRALTLEQLADLAHISPSYLQRMETGGRNVSLKNLARLALALNVSQNDLVIGSGSKRVPIVGYVGAGAETLLFSEGQGPFGYVEAPDGSTEKTVAVEIRGTSLGELFDQWLVFYDDVHDPPTPSLIGQLCIVGLPDGRVLVKKLQRGQLEGRFNLLSNTEPPIYDVKIVWAAKVKAMTPR